MRYIIIDKGKLRLFKRVYIISIPFYWIYCVINKYKLSIFERSDLN